MAERVIFLDIDGVVAPIQGYLAYGELDPGCVGVLNTIVERSGADVVISSSWRFSITVAEFQQMLEAAGFVGRVIGATPTDARGATRDGAIAAWLADHPVASFVILDDHRDLGALIDKLVQTDRVVGLRPTDAERALAVLGLAVPPGQPAR